MIKFLLILCTLSTLSYSSGYKILNVFHTTSKSHDNLGEAINKHLLNAGHEVTYITPFLDKPSHPNLRRINVTSNFDMVPKDQLSIKSINKFISHELVMLGTHLCSIWTVENENVKKLLNDPNERFDLVIVDFMFNEILFSGIAKIYDAPIIWVATTEPHWAISKYVDEAMSPAYSSDFLSPNLSPFTFWQRVQELWYQLKVTFYREFILNYFDASAYNRLIAPIIKARGREPPAPQDLRYNASLVIGNSHVSLGEALSLPQNYIGIGGFHIDDQVKPLPENLKKIMDDAKHGVIYFSMGSLIQSKDLPEDVKRALLNMFGTLKQTVLWKFEDELDDLPKNVHILKWAPQQSILAHPKCVLFITHGGLLSTTETIHFGVPIIGLPVFADQFTNVAKAMSKGFAVKVHFQTTPDVAGELKAAIEEVLGNPKYKQKIDELSLIYHDRPVKPGVELLHWTEHVIKTRGALHLRSSALLVTWYQKYYFDLAALIVLIVTVLKHVYKVLRGVLFKTKNAERKKEKNY